MKNELVETKRGKVWSTSVIFSREFDIAHVEIMRKIRILTMENPIVKNMFLLTEYENERQRKYPMYYLDRDGYMFLVMNISTKKTNEIKLKFIQAFNLMEKALINQHDASWLDSRDEGKLARISLTDSIKDFVDYATKQGSKNAQHYYSNCSKMTYKALELVDQNKTTPIRDMLSRMELGFLMVAENIAQKSIEEGMKRNDHYKDIYQQTKRQIEVFSESINLNGRRLLNGRVVSGAYHEQSKD